jgi:membrane protease YdiL (CAAX protease family)
MVAAVLVVGLAAEAVAWWLVAFRGLDVWKVMTPVFLSMGIAAILAGPPEWSPEVRPTVAATAGLASGALLYAATRLFVFLVAGPWRSFRDHSLATYERQGSLPLATALLLSVALTVPWEELFWRGLFQPELVSALDGRTAVAAVLTWVAYAVANLPSANLAFLAGAVVGGAVWCALGWWSGGALAPLVSHAVWTALMLWFPVVRREALA